jgi:hypothetical protein
MERELHRRLAPLHRLDLLVGQRFHADGEIESPLTDMTGLADLPFMELHQIDAREVDQDIDLMLAVRFGAVSPRYEADLAKRGVRVVREAAQPIDAAVLTRLALSGSLREGDWGMHKAMREHAGAPIPADPVWSQASFYSRSAFGWSQYRCGWRQYLRKLPLEWPYVLVVGDTFRDFALGLALERITGFASWISRRLVNGDGELEDDVRHELVRVLDDSHRRSGEPVNVVSLSLDDADLTATVDRIRAARYVGAYGGEHIFPKAYRDTEHGWPRRLYDERSEDIRYEPFEGNTMVGMLTTPQPSVIGTNPERVTWQVDVLVGDVHFPVRSALDKVVVATGDRETDRVRSGSEGISYHSHSLSVFTFANSPLDQRLARPRLRAPTANEVFQALLAHAGLRGARSNAGRFTEQTIERFGGLDAALEAVRSPIAGKVLQAYRSKAESGVAPGVWLTGLRRRFLSLDDMAKAASLVSDEDIAKLRLLADDFVTRRLLRRGLALVCPICRYAGWFRLADLDEEVACQRCRTKWVITQPTWRLPKNEPAWHYELDEIVFQAVEGNVAGVLITLDKLREKARGDFLFTPEMDVFEKDVLLAEVDIWVAVQGRVVMGEAKTTDALDDKGKDDEVAQRLFRVADAVSADELVISTTQPAWRPKSKNAIDTQRPKWPRLRVRVLEGVS